MGVKCIIQTSELWGGSLLGYPIIQEREDRDKKVGEETFMIKVQEKALKWAEGKWKKIEEHKVQGDRDKGKDEDKIVYAKRFKMMKTVTSEIHEWEMIELKKKNGLREQNVYKTKGPDITIDNQQYPILRPIDGEKLEEWRKNGR